MTGHLRQWMEDATGNILAEYAGGCYEEVELSDARLGDLEAARALESLAEALKHGLDALCNETFGKKDSPWIAETKTKMRNALLAVED